MHAWGACAPIAPPSPCRPASMNFKISHFLPLVSRENICITKPVKGTRYFYFERI